MHILFVKQGEYEKGDAAFSMIESAARVFLKKRDSEASNCGNSHLYHGDGIVARGSDREYGVPYDIAGVKVRRYENGKPFIEDADIDVSVTHSEDMWMCLVSDGRCGIDFQYFRDAKYEELAARFYSDSEQRYVLSGDIEARFFDIWVRREAYGKYTGDGFWVDAPDCPGDTGVTIKMITQDDLNEAGISVGKDFRCAAVFQDNDELCIMKL